MTERTGGRRPNYQLLGTTGSYVEVQSSFHERTVTQPSQPPTDIMDQVDGVTEEVRNGDTSDGPSDNDDLFEIPEGTEGDLTEEELKEQQELKRQEYIQQQQYQEHQLLQERLLQKEEEQRMLMLQHEEDERQRLLREQEHERNIRMENLMIERAADIEAKELLKNSQI